MADKTRIEWTDATWNPVRGCTRVSAGCQHCYAERVAARFSGDGQPYAGLIHPSTKGWNGKVRLVPEVLDQPLRWRRPRRIFVNSMSDLFHDEVPFIYVAAVLGIAAAAPQHTFQILTKRPQRALEFFNWHALTVKRRELQWEPWRVCEDEANELVVNLPAIGCQSSWPLHNVWLGVSVEDQAAANERIPLLLQCPAAVRWISAEPLLGRVDLCEHLGMWWNSTMQCFESIGQRINRHSDGRPRIGWVVAGGESGPGARPMSVDWARSLRDQCAAAGVPFLFKQWGEWLPMLGQAANVPVRAKATTSDGWVMGLAGKKAAGRLLDGVQHDAYPEAP